VSSHAKFCGGIAAVFDAVLMTVTPTLAQIANSIEQAELAGLSPEKRAQVQSRMKQGAQTVSERLQTILLNEIKRRFPASRIVALDFAGGIPVVQTSNGAMRTVNFDTTDAGHQGLTAERWYAAD
jgi:CHAT domain-containing protein